MGSTLILKVRICLKPLKHFFHQGGSAFVNIKPPVSSVVPPTARFLCTRDTDPHPETDRRRAEVRRRDGAVEERYKKPFELQSVFTAGTAKRVAEKMKKKTSVAHEEEKPARLANRTVGRRNCNWCIFTLTLTLTVRTFCVKYILENKTRR